jgi:hypothetical protein
LGLHATFGQINFGQTLGNDIHGFGVSTTTTANFTQPAINAAVTVSVVSTAGFPTTYPGNGKVWIIGGGIYNLTVIDSTHISLYNTGFPENAAAGATISSGAVVGISGLTFEMFYDPITANQTQILVCSGGSRGSGPASEAFLFANNYTNSSNFISINITTTNGSFSVTSTNAVTAGNMNHVAFTYDGIHLCVFVNGTKTSTTATGTIVQNNYETIMIGQDVSGWGITVGDLAYNYGTGFQYGSVRMCQQAIYNANFTAPTSELILINRLTAFLVNFSSAHRPVVPAPTGFGSPNLAAGYIIAQSTTVNYNLNPYHVWLRFQPWGDNYSIGSNVSDLQFQSIGACITTSALLNSNISRCNFFSYSRGLEICQFSYRTRISDCVIQVQGNAAGNYWNFGIGIDQGSAFVEVSNTQIVSNGWAITSQCGGLFSNLYIVPSGFGAYFFADVSPGQPATIIDNYIYDDQTFVTDCAMFIGSLSQLNIFGGAIALATSPGIPLFRMGGCQATNIEAILDLDIGGSLPTQGIFHFEPVTLDGFRTGPIRLSGQRYYPDNKNITAVGTFHVINGSNTVTASTAQTFIAGAPVTFITQPNSKYIVASTVTSSTTFTLTQAYSGTTATATTIYLPFYEPWMPEDGYGIQGPVYITPQELSSHTINWVTDTDYTALVNDFLWKTIYVQDTNNVMTTSHNLFLPCIAGYERIIYNYTNYNINVGCNANATVPINPGQKAYLSCAPLQINGTVSLNALNANVTGTGTSFTTLLKVNQPVYFSSDPDKYYIVKSITDDTHLVLSAGYEEMSISSTKLLTPTWTVI